MPDQTLDIQIEDSKQAQFSLGSKEKKRENRFSIYIGGDKKIPDWYCPSSYAGTLEGTDEIVEYYVTHSDIGGLVTNAVVKKFANVKVEIEPCEGEEVDEEWIRELEIQLLGNCHTPSGRGDFVDLREHVIKMLHWYCAGACLYILGNSEMELAPKELTGEDDVELPTYLIQMTDSDNNPMHYPSGNPIFATGFKVLERGTFHRTGNIDFPVLYQSPIDNKNYLLHHSRVWLKSLNPSSDPSMLGVGYSPMYNSLRTIIKMKEDADRLIGEKPSRQLLYVKKGNVSANDIKEILMKADSKSEDMPADKMQSIPIVSSDEDDVDLELEVLELDSYSKLEGDNRLERFIAGATIVATNNMLTLADLNLAGLVKRASGANAEAEQKSNLESGLFSTLQRMLDQLTRKALPPSLRFVAKRDVERSEKERADIEKTLSEVEKVYLEQKVYDNILVLQLLMARGVISKSQYDDQLMRIELEAGINRQTEEESDTEPEQDYELLANDQGVETDSDTSDSEQISSFEEESISMFKPYGKSFTDDIGTYQRKLTKVFTMVSNQDINPSTGIERVEILSHAIFILAFIDGKWVRQTNSLSEAEQKAFKSAQKVLGSGGFSQVEMTTHQRTVIDSNLPFFRGEVFLRQAFSFEEMEDVLGVFDDIKSLSREAVHFINTIKGQFEQRGLEGRELQAKVKQAITDRASVMNSIANGYRYLGMIHDPRNPVLQWVCPAFDNCVDCLALDSRTMTVQEWRKFKRETGLYPRSIHFECGNCGCSFKRIARSLKNFNLSIYGIDKDVAIQYLDSLLTHIGYVQEAGRNIGVPESQVLVHDESKFSFDEFVPYAIHFFGGGGNEQDFEYAKLLHYHRNPHHPIHWEIAYDNYNPENTNIVNGLFKMPENYALEMVADWMGAGRAYTGSWDMTEWLDNNAGKIRLHPETAIYVNNILSRLGYKRYSFKD